MDIDSSRVASIAERSSLMAEGKNPGVPLELERIRELISLMEKHDLSEIDLQDGEKRCRLRRGPQNVSVVSGTPQYAIPQQAPAAAPVSSGAAAAPAAAAAVNDGSILIKSPTVGTFYLSPSPDDPPFVKLGATVKADTVVCLIEAMKVYNQITADVAGTVTEVLVANAEPVEFGQPLFRIKP
jgi:acetyl-CoA carboxylase biotin carboxyl carrier protein